jgi:hypothetical protein
MTLPWSLTITAPDRSRTVTGSAKDRPAAVSAGLDAAKEDADTARETGAAPARYELWAEHELAAIVQAGPDHPDTTDLLDRLITQHGPDGSIGRLPAPGPLDAGLSDRAGHH